MNLQLLDFLILALATYAIAHYVTREDGPFAVFLRFRRWVGAEVDAADIPIMGDEAWYTEASPEVKPGSIAALFACPYCLSPYAAVVSLFLWYVAWPVALVLGLAGVSVLVLELTAQNRD